MRLGKSRSMGDYFHGYQIRLIFDVSYVRQQNSIGWLLKKFEFLNLLFYV